MYIKNKGLSIFYKFLICVVGIFGILANTNLLDSGVFVPNMFATFTILSNIACTLYFIFDIFHIKKFGNQNNFCPILKAMITVNITVTLLVAHFILNLNFSFDTFFTTSFLFVHYIVPIMVILDWLLFDKKGNLKIHYIFTNLIFPLLYLGAILLLVNKFEIFNDGFFNMSGISNQSRYPYPFIDFDVLTTSQAIINVLLMTAGIIILGFIFFILDFLMYKKSSNHKYFI